MNYSLYFIDAGDRIERVIRFEAADDDHAVERALTEAPTSVVELWQGSRPLTRLESGRAVAIPRAGG